ncbi:hypothetical protein [Planococcus versutus]|uniref:Uncharacterized protein n=1 Tax=Planococcus versutus TaxID=1302659 RepID=A0A1B1S334_9BACL|nr:hypothetical protein [Planococcus versutus]ANU27593.1 hypothetical protein I858_011415 [Planococcus versutus]
MTKNNPQGRNMDHQKDDNKSTADKILEKTSEMLSGGDEAWESSGKNEAHDNTDTKTDFQNTPDEGAGDVPTEDKVIRDVKTGEKTVIKNDNKNWSR